MTATAPLPERLIARRLTTTLATIAQLAVEYGVTLYRIDLIWRRHSTAQQRFDAACRKKKAGSHQLWERRRNG